MNLILGAGLWAGLAEDFSRQAAAAKVPLQLVRGSESPDPLAAIEELRDSEEIGDYVVLFSHGDVKHLKQHDAHDHSLALGPGENDLVPTLKVINCLRRGRDGKGRPWHGLIEIVGCFSARLAQALASDIGPVMICSGKSSVATQDGRALVLEQIAKVGNIRAEGRSLDPQELFEFSARIFGNRVSLSAPGLPLQIKRARRVADLEMVDDVARIRALRALIYRGKAMGVRELLQRWPELANAFLPGTSLNMLCTACFLKQAEVVRVLLLSAAFKWNREAVQQAVAAAQLVPDLLLLISAGIEGEVIRRFDERSPTGLRDEVRRCLEDLGLEMSAQEHEDLRAVLAGQQRNLSQSAQILLFLAQGLKKLLNHFSGADDNQAGLPPQGAARETGRACFNRASSFPSSTLGVLRRAE